MPQPSNPLNQNSKLLTNLSAAFHYSLATVSLTHAHCIELQFLNLFIEHCLCNDTSFFSFEMRKVIFIAMFWDTFPQAFLWLDSRTAIERLEEREIVKYTCSVEVNEYNKWARCICLQRRMITIQSHLVPFKRDLIFKHYYNWVAFIYPIIRSLANWKLINNSHINRPSQLMLIVTSKKFLSPYIFS